MHLVTECGYLEDVVDVAEPLELRHVHSIFTVIEVGVFSAICFSLASSTPPLFLPFYICR